MLPLKISSAFRITGPSPVGTIYKPDSYSEYNQRDVRLTVTNTVGQFNFSFLTNLRVDESKLPRVLLGPDSIITSTGALFAFQFNASSVAANMPSEAYVGDDTDGYLWLITLPIFLKGAGGATVDIPATAVVPFILTIDLQWDCKERE